MAGLGEHRARLAGAAEGGAQGTLVGIEGRHRHHAAHEHARLTALADTEPAGLLAVSADVDPDRREGTELTYLHGVAVTEAVEVPGDLDVVPVDDVLRFEREFLDYLHRDHSGVLDTIRESGDFPDDTEKAVTEAYDQFLDQFETSEGKSLHAGREEFEAMDHDEVEQEQIVKQKRG